MRWTRLLLAALLCLPVLTGCSTETPAEHAANVYAQHELDASPRHENIPDYQLSPDAYAKMKSLVAVRSTMHFVSAAWDILSLLLLLSLGVIGWIRDRAVALSKYRWVQGYAFLAMYSIVGWLVGLPIELYGQYLSRHYGLSVQSWGSYFVDDLKGFLVGWILGGLVFMLLFWVIRKFPQRWWLVFWGFTIPLVVFAIFVSPYINFLFNKYEPLTKNNAALVARLEQVVEKNHLDIPPERMFLMKASEKVTTMNADVEGFGASKRVVVWDNTIAKMKPDEIVMVFGHESGHYILHHIEEGFWGAVAGLFVALFLAFHFVRWAIARFGLRWRVAGTSDWAAYAVLSLAFTLMSTLAEPINNYFVRTHEHDADVFGQEVIHGLVADPQAAAQGAFDALGIVSFSDPNPNPLYEIWTYNHPGVGRRAAFAHAYDPWAPGMDPKYFKK